MRLLLDTHAFLWWIDDSPQLGTRTRRLIGNPAYQLYLSLASSWEIAIKVSIGKLTLAEPIDKFIPGQLQQNGITQLDIGFRHVARVANLPFYHRDPFDRLIAAQCLVEQLALVTADPAFAKYGIKRVW